VHKFVETLHYKVLTFTLPKLFLISKIVQLYSHTGMDASIQSQGYVQAYAILGFWIAAIPAAMTVFGLLAEASY
jgi:hypothetical protein